MPSPLVAIVGRPNVGKSSLFNRLIEAQAALVEDLPGVTRDLLYRETTWNGVTFRIVDTGGFREDPEALFRSVSAQVEAAVREASLVLFVVDARAGVTPEEEALARRLRQLGADVILVANKVDAPQVDTADLYRLGMGDPVAVSAAHGLGTGDLLDLVVERLPAGDEDGEESEEPIRLALVGRPNVGKSTLMNALLGSRRSVVSEVPGTTTDPVDAPFTHNGRPFVLVDTAGIRRAKKVGERLEARSVKRTEDAIARSDIVILLLDATTGILAQDQKICRTVTDAGRGLVFAVNKWDAVAKETGTAEAFTREIRERFADASYAPVVYLSAETGQRVERVILAAVAVFAEFERRIPAMRLTRALEEAMALTPPPSEKGRRLRVLFATQGRGRPPTFVLFCNDPRLVPDSYRRYLEGHLRRTFRLSLTPIRIVFRARTREAARARPRARP